MEISYLEYAKAITYLHITKHYMFMDTTSCTDEGI